MEINAIKQRLPILTVLAHYNLIPDRHHQILCPFHPDDKPSCKFTPKPTPTIVLPEAKAAM